MELARKPGGAAGGTDVRSCRVRHGPRKPEPTWLTTRHGVPCRSVTGAGHLKHCGGWRSVGTSPVDLERGHQKYLPPPTHINAVALHRKDTEELAPPAQANHCSSRIAQAATGARARTDGQWHRRHRHRPAAVWRTLIRVGRQSRRPSNASCLTSPSRTGGLTQLSQGT
jgi:hypothetical protein